MNRRLLAGAVLVAVAFLAGAAATYWGALDRITPNSQAHGEEAKPALRGPVSAVIFVGASPLSEALATAVDADPHVATVLRAPDGRFDPNALPAATIAVVDANWYRSLSTEAGPTVEGKPGLDDRSVASAAISDLFLRWRTDVPIVVVGEDAPGAFRDFGLIPGFVMSPEGGPPVGIAAARHAEPLPQSIQFGSDPANQASMTSTLFGALEWAAGREP